MYHSWIWLLVLATCREKKKHSLALSLIQQQQNDIKPGLFVCVQVKSTTHLSMTGLWQYYKANPFAGQNDNSCHVLSTPANLTSFNAIYCWWRPKGIQATRLSHARPGRTLGMEAWITLATSSGNPRPFLCHTSSQQTSIYVGNKPIKGDAAKTRPPETLNCSKSKTCRAKELKLYQPDYLIS